MCVVATFAHTVCIRNKLYNV